MHLGFVLHLLLFHESLLHYWSIMCVTVMVFCVCMNDSVHILYIGIYFCLWRRYLWCALILHVAFSFTTCVIMLVCKKKTILMAMCVVKCSGLHSDFLVFKLQFYTVHFTVLFCKCVYSLQPQLAELFCKNYRFFLQCASFSDLISLHKHNICKLPTVFYSNQGHCYNPCILRVDPLSRGPHG